MMELETGARVLIRVSKRPTARRPTSAIVAEAKARIIGRGRERPPRAAPNKSASRQRSSPTLGERVLALATGKTRQELYAACPTDRPNRVGMAIQRHLRTEQILQRDGKLHAAPPAAAVPDPTA